MPTEPVDVPGITSEAPTEPTEAAPVVEAPPETIAFKVRGEERQITAANLDALAGELGTSRDAAIMWLQSGKDYGQHIQELRQRERELAQYEAQLRQEYEQFQRSRQAGSQTAGPAGPAGIPQTDDPMAYLRHIAERVTKLDELERQIAERDKFWTQTFEQQRQQEERSRIESAYSHLKDRMGREFPGVPVPQWADIEQELLASGLAQNSRLSWDDAMWRAAKNLSFEAALQVRERTALDRLRDPKAQVVVPGAGTAQAPKAPGTPPNQLDQLGNMKWGDIVDNST